MSLLRYAKSAVLFAVSISAIHIGCLVLLVAKPFLARQKYAKLATWVQLTFLAPCVYFYESNPNMKIRITGDEIPDKESALVISNHLNNDWGPLYSLALRKRMLGNSRFITKDILKFVPGFGLGMYLMNWPQLKRNWQKDKNYLKNMMQGYKADGEPVWVICFAEGTRFTSQKLFEAKQFALERGLTAPVYCLLPRPKGFKALVKGLRGVVTHVYDVTIAYSGWPYKKHPGPSGLDLMFPDPKVQCTMHMHIRRVSMKDLPRKDEKALQKWLYDAWIEKDRLMHHFYEKKEFPGGKNQAEPIECDPVMWAAVKLGAQFYGTTLSILAIASIYYRYFY